MSAPVLATWITRQLIFDGIVNGVSIGLLALGIVLVYRSTRVINFAVANMGIVGASLVALMVTRYGVPFWLAVGVGLFVGTVYGAVIELVVVRRLFLAPRVIVLIATIGVSQLSLAIVLSYPSIEDVGARFPVPVGSTWEDVFGLRVRGPQVVALVVVPLAAALLAWFLNGTVIGKTVKASASNADLARLSAINPKSASTMVWAIAGLLATLSMLLLAGVAGSANTVTGLGPATLERALAAAVIAGMVSFTRALLSGIAIGVLEALVRFNFLEQTGLVDGLLLVAILVAVWFQSRRPAETATFSYTPRSRPIPDRLRELWWVRHMAAIGFVGLGAAAAILPFVVAKPSRLVLYSTIILFALCAQSVSILAGWSGQVSLGQMAFAGLGALLAASFQRGLSVDIGWRDTRVVNGSLPALPFGVSVALSTLVITAIAVLIGLGSLRVRGLLLAVSTFAFGLAAQQYLYRQPLFAGENTSTVPLQRGSILGVDVTTQRAYYLFSLGVLGVVVVIVCRLRRSGSGRSAMAVRDNVNSAAAYAVAPTGVKLRTFALSGGLAALSGGLLGGLVVNIPLTARLFTVNESLQVVAIAVIGGLGSVIGPILGALWVIGLPAFFPDNDVVPLLSSSLGLLILLLYFPGGLAQVVYSVRDGLLHRVAARMTDLPAKTVHAMPVAARHRLRAPVTLERPCLVARNMRVRFGGVRAVDGVSIDVGPREIVGLIGTNGAGKTTLMNAIGGFVPSDGAVELLGDDVSGHTPAQRASIGLGRTFQAATLFPELTVRETVLVALESRGRTGMLATALGLPAATKRERARRAEAGELIDFLGLGRYADAYIADLSTGTRRIVELAGLLALDARVLCLDEPTSGVAQRETEAFGPLVVELSRELDASILLIEHDMPLIMSISNRVYCLELGSVIAHGTPSEVRNDPNVIASYLGLDERAIVRSGRTADANALEPQHASASDA